MGLIDKLINGAVDKLVVKPYLKREAQKLREDMENGGWDEDFIDHVVEEVCGEQTVKEVNYRRNVKNAADKKAKQIQERERLNRLKAVHACSVCYWYKHGYCEYDYINNSEPFEPQLRRIEHPDNTTCGQYSPK